ncbi:hypothetical protein ACQJBY_054443 [Aegilops geniculata]
MRVSHILMPSPHLSCCNEHVFCANDKRGPTSLSSCLVLDIIFLDCYCSCMIVIPLGQDYICVVELRFVNVVSYLKSVCMYIVVVFADLNSEKFFINILALYNLFFVN